MIGNWCSVGCQKSAQHNMFIGQNILKLNELFLSCTMLIKIYIGNEIVVDVVFADP